MKPFTYDGPAHPAEAAEAATRLPARFIAGGHNRWTDELNRSALAPDRRQRPRLEQRGRKRRWLADRAVVRISRTCRRLRWCGGATADRSRALLAGGFRQLRLSGNHRGQPAQRTRARTSTTPTEVHKRPPGAAFTLWRDTAGNTHCGPSEACIATPERYGGRCARRCECREVRAGGAARTLRFGVPAPAATAAVATHADRRTDTAVTCPGRRRRADLSQGARPAPMPSRLVGCSHRAARGSARVALGGVAHKPWR